MGGSNLVGHEVKTLFPSPEASMKWITGNNIKVDRVACPWLISRLVDPEAKFLFANETELL
jgi:hypothetical protein